MQRDRGASPGMLLLFESIVGMFLTRTMQVPKSPTFLANVLIHKSYLNSLDQNAGCNMRALRLGSVLVHLPTPSSYHFCIVIDVLFSYYATIVLGFPNSVKCSLKRFFYNRCLDQVLAVNRPN